MDEGLDIPQDILRPAQIATELASLGMNEHTLLYNRETLSTNNDVLQHYEQNRQLAIAVCETQTAGKGRRGRRWVSPFAQNIYCTVGLTKSLAASHLGLLSIVSGIALCRALADYCDVEAVRLKWPNDLVYLGDGGKHKLGGILIESKPVEGGYFLAIGFGINVHMTRQQLEAIPQAATSLSLISSKQLERQSVLIAALEAVVNAIDRFEEAEIESVLETFSQHDAFYDQQICLLNGDNKVYGVNAGINRSGQLLLSTDQGVLPFSAAEISLRAID